MKRFSVVLVSLDPTVGREIKKTRPCLIVSPDQMNRHISTLIVAPMTTKGNQYPTRVKCKFQNVEGQVVLDQIRTIDKSRVIKVVGSISKVTQKEVLKRLGEIFSP
jgi:mRNA interferase MazF